MSGGIAYVMDQLGDFKKRCNLGMVDVEPLELEEDVAFVRALIEQHIEHTRSEYAERILEDWGKKRRSKKARPEFLKVMPRDYRRVLAAKAYALAEGREPTFAELVGSTSG